MMNVVAPPNPSAWPPIQIRTKKKIAQRSEMTPWSNAGSRRCITRRILLKRRPRAGLPAFWTKKIHRAGCAFVHLPREPSASAYGPRERLRPTRAPCSVLDQRTPDGHGGARPGRPKKALFADAKLSTFPRLLWTAWGQLCGQTSDASLETRRRPHVLPPT